MQRSHPAAKRYAGNEDGRENESQRTVPPLSRFGQISFRRPTQRPDGGPAPKMCSTMRLALGSSVLSEALTSEPPSELT